MQEVIKNNSMKKKHNGKCAGKGKKPEGAYSESSPLGFKIYPDTKDTITK